LYKSIILLKHAFIKLKYLLSIIFILFWYVNTTAQTYNFKNFNVADGLPQSQVNCVIQDYRGYLWIGTAGGGICKFDGINFITYTEKDGIAGNIINDITEDKDGNIWFTSTWGGITKYNGRNFIIFTKKDGLFSDDNNEKIF